MNINSNAWLVNGTGILCDATFWPYVDFWRWGKTQWRERCITTLTSNLAFYRLNTFGRKESRLVSALSDRTSCFYSWQLSTVSVLYLLNRYFAPPAFAVCMVAIFSGSWTTSVSIMFFDLSMQLTCLLDRRKLNFSLTFVSSHLHQMPPLR